MRVWIIAATIGAAAGLAGAAQAEDLGRQAEAGLVSPSFYRAAIAPGSSVPTRRGPSAAAEQTTVLYNGDGPLEVLAIVEGPDGAAWAEFVEYDHTAFVELRHLEPVDAPMIAGTTIPQHLGCSGRAPSWAVELPGEGGAGSMVLMLGGGQDFAITDPVVVAARDGRPAAFAFEEDALRGVLTVDAAWCSSGAADIRYGWRASLLLEHDGAAPTLYEGCCKLLLTP